ncbi:(2Fe-2S)-binding protein [candidate division KSB1 bacterium]|nr:(2Fe-2S)-binding protein [candidate division KSB1 bacterium]
MEEVKITVDGKELTVAKGTLLIDACEANGIYIPRFCYHKHLTKSGNCRMCLVKIEKTPKPQPSCMTPVADGMIVHTRTPEIDAMRKAMLEFVLINHPLDCPICDKAGECMLQDQYMEFSGDKSRFNETKVAKEKLYHFSDRILYDAERCITCSRCVRFTSEVSKTNKLGLVLRGDSSYVSLAPGDTFDDPYSDCVTDICPVGALTSKQFRFKERVWNLHKTPSICAGCSRGCNISIETKDNQVYRVRPIENEHVNKSWMCNFGRDYYVHPTAERLTSQRSKKNDLDYNTFIKEVTPIFKENGAKMAFIVSSHATNEELALAKQLADVIGVKDIFTKSDREWKEDSGEVKEDDILITADKTPNLAGVKKTFTKAKDISTLTVSPFTHAFVWGVNASVKDLTKLKLIVLSTERDVVSDKADYLIAGQTPAEKHGSFTNIDGLVQPFRRAIRGEQNTSDLQFFVDVLKTLGETPLGRTVDEVRAAL